MSVPRARQMGHGGGPLGTYTVSLYCLKGKNFNLDNQVASQSYTLASPAYTVTFSQSKC